MRTRPDMNDIARGTSIEDAIKIVRESYWKSTWVVGWYDKYSFNGEIRGPFCRWLNVKPFNKFFSRIINVDAVDPMYLKNVASLQEDAKYTAACMNYAPKLIDHIDLLNAELNRTKADLDQTLRTHKKQVETLETNLASVQFHYAILKDDLKEKGILFDANGNLR